MFAKRGFLADRIVLEEEENKRVNQLFTGLQKYSNFLVQNKWDADDLVQDALAKAFQNYQPSELSSALLNKIAYHQWIDTLRKRKHEVIENLEDLHDQNSACVQNELFDTVKFLLTKLTPKQAIIFTLKEAFCYQIKEIAELLNTTETAIKSTLHRARKRLEIENPFQTVDSYWCEEDTRLLSDLMYQSLQAEDPAILIDCISVIPAFAGLPQLGQAKRSSSNFNLSCLAA